MRSCVINGSYYMMQNGVRYSELLPNSKNDAYDELHGNLRDENTN